MMRWSNESTFDGAIRAAASAYTVPFALVKAIVAVESGFNPAALNTSDPGYAWGLMQMIPATARGLGYTGPMLELLNQPSLALQLGTQLLRENLTQTRGSIPDAVSAYNGGFRPALGFGAMRNGRYQNQTYVDRVLAEYRYFGGKGGAAASGGSFRPAPPPRRVVADAIPVAWVDRLVVAVVVAFGVGWMTWCTLLS